MVKRFFVFPINAEFISTTEVGEFGLQKLTRI